MYLTYIQGILHHIDAPKLWGPIGKRVGLECSGYNGGINLYFSLFFVAFLVFYSNYSQYWKSSSHGVSKT